MKETTAKAIASLAAATVCGLMVYFSHGGWGAGWMCFALFLIWSE